MTEANCPAPLPVVGVERRVLAGADGAPAVGVFVVNARPGANRPGIVHMHGGGFFAGSARASLRETQKIAAQLDCTVVSVEYRLAPEVSYSGSVEDNYSALCWLHENAASLGVDRERIAVMGESAGGGHAVLLCATARNRGGPSILFQALSYPMLDDRTGSTRNYAAAIGTVGWNAQTNHFGWRCFLGQEPGGRGVPGEAVPARIENCACLPPTFIGVGSLDLFVEENIEFARRLIHAQVPVELLVLPGAFHAFDTLVGEAAISKRFAAARADALGRAFAGRAGINVGAAPS